MQSEPTAIVEDFVAPKMARLPVTLALTMIVGLAGFSACVVIFAYAFPRGIDFGDEGNSIYLLMHPRAPTAFMDQFVWGQIARALTLNVVAMRWATLGLMLSSNALLCLACLHAISRIFFPAASRSQLWTLCLSLSTLGALLFFSLGAWEINYTGTLVFAANLFGACIFARTSDTPVLRLLLDIIMGIMAAFAFMARGPDGVFLLGLFVFCAWFIDLNGWAKSLLFMTTSCVISILVAFLFDYDIVDQLQFLYALTFTTHRAVDLLRGDVPRGTEILLIAIGAAAFYAVAERHRVQFRDERFGLAILVILAGAVSTALAYMAVRGYFVAAAASSDPLYANRLLSSLAPGIHAATLSLLCIVAAPVLAARIPQLQKWFRAEHDVTSVTVLKYAVVLYMLCIIPQLGTNNGVWSRPVGLGPVFLAVALLLANELRKARFAEWMMPVVIFLVSIPVAADLYAKTIAHARINGSAFNQTAVLEHPSALRGLATTPSIAAFQSNLEKALASAGFDPQHDVILPATRQFGVLALVGATAFTGGSGLLEAYDHVEIWNCAIIKLGLRNRPARIFVLDFELIDDRTKGCLTGYRISSTVRVDVKNSITILSK